jgi:hypothetical protein
MTGIERRYWRGWAGVAVIALGVPFGEPCIVDQFGPALPSEWTVTYSKAFISSKLAWQPATTSRISPLTKSLLISEKRLGHFSGKSRMITSLSVAASWMEIGLEGVEASRRRRDDLSASRSDWGIGVRSARISEGSMP